MGAYKIPPGVIRQLSADVREAEMRAEREAHDPKTRVLGLSRMRLVEACRRELLFILLSRSTVAASMHRAERAAMERLGVTRKTVHSETINKPKRKAS